uniref:Predicted protein putative n=1 Tax=Albugo laibachii Nc14 TaxID=890382 RepID=F0VYS8_9STRA|nr:predicted protein putative [Albugo laibachii Nc14]|eukprot:CCA13943.1 predicted protein putative [Albugo laibachii Nc14]
MILHEFLWRSIICDASKVLRLTASNNEFIATHNRYDRLRLSRTTQRDQKSFRWLLERIPSGFGRFLPKQNGKRAGKDGLTKEKSKSGSSAKGEQTKAENNGTSKNDAKIGANKNGGNGPKQGFAYLVPLAVVGLLLSDLSNFDKPTQEITYQEFRTSLLETGSVEKLVVVNNKYVVVYLHPSSSEVAIKGNNSRTDNYGGTHHDEDRPWNNRLEFGRDFANQSDDGQYQKRSPSIASANRDNYVNRKLKGHHQYYFNIGSVESFERQLEQAQREIGIASHDFIPVQYTSEVNFLMEIFKFVPTIVLVGLLLMSMRGLGGGAPGGGGGIGNIFRVGKSPAKKIVKEDIKISFKDVAGVDEAKKEIMEFVDFLKNQTRFTKLGAKIPKGALLVGPPGTGKTLLAKATAGEASVPFYSISGSDFIEMFVGVGPSRVRDLFREARANAPCIVFIDEIDAVARTRSKGQFSGGNDERENTLNQLLVEMDGFNSTEGVVVLAGTNRADILDKAILRPGRFDRQITVDKPDIKGRRAIFKVHLKNLQLDNNIDDFARRLAALTPGFAGAEIANICNEAAIVAARRSATTITFADFEKATDRIIGGLETNRIMTPEEKKIVAYHEAGHAVAGWFLEHADPLLKVTIVPRGKGSLGYAQYLPKEIALHSKDAMLDLMCMALGGRASEFVNFEGRITTGASDDLRRVTQIAYSMVQLYGMNDRIGQLSFPKDDSSLVSEKPYSEKTAEIMDQEVLKIVNAAYERTKTILLDKKDLLKELAEELLTNETINHSDIVRVLGPRPFGNNKTYTEYVEESWRQADQFELEKKIKEEDEERSKAAAATQTDEENSTGKSDETDEEAGDLEQKELKQDAAEEERAR